MLSLLREVIKNLPNAILALALAIAVWISAVSDADPTEERTYPRSVSIELIGKDPGLVLISNVPSQVSVTLSAPNSIWERLLREQSAVRAIADLSGLGPGTHDVPIQIQVGISPVRVVSYGPESVSMTLDSIITRTYSIHLIENGEPATGFQAEQPVLSSTTVTVSGPASLVEQVQEISAVLDIEGVFETVNRALFLEALDINGSVIDDLTITPSTVNVSQKITQRGGYRNVVVKVITSGQIASGYRVTNISVFPPAVTVFSTDPVLVDELPGYVETESLDLSGLNDDLEVYLNLDLPPGISLVGEQTVEVQVGIASIEGSITLEDMEVEILGLAEGFASDVSPKTVDVILSGPLHVLEAMTTNDIRIYVELHDESEGIYQRIPQIELLLEDLRVESLLPASVEVRITLLPTPTPTATIELTSQALKASTTPGTPVPASLTPTSTPVP
ncbi:MAG: CdaR family protein [Anaerolineaceae bacterium]|nr:CdaR family protein [Anaerolineaceae bacterium]